MEKIIYVLSKDGNVSGDEFRDTLINTLCPQIESTAEKIQLYTVDSDVALASISRTGQEAASHIPQAPAADAVLSVWLRSVTQQSKHIERCLESVTRAAHAYLVTESEPLPNTIKATSPARRSTGFDQVCLIEKPKDLDYAQWLQNWQGLHTSVAIDTQSTCRYTQNVVVRAITKGAPRLHAIVEEGYPDEAAMHDPMVFYDAKDDHDKLQRHAQMMMESCSRFIDFENQPCDLIGMSQYVVK